MSSSREAQRLQDIVENIDAARSYVGDMAIEAFIADRKTVDACERCLQRITEAVIKIGEDDNYGRALDRWIRSMGGKPIYAKE